MKIYVTGASGFVGDALIKTALNRDLPVCGLIRPKVVNSNINDETILSPSCIAADWLLPESLVKIFSRDDVLVHCAARVHVMNEVEENAIAIFRAVNVQGTLNLARCAAMSGLKRFVFISSIKVNGESTELGVPFSTLNMPLPVDSYGLSKLEAEEGLLNIAAESAMEVVILRAPLVYGPGVKGNFANMIKWISSGLPLPLGSIHNLRSMVGIDNLIDLIIRCIDHPAAANKVLLAGDGQDVSTTELLRAVGQAMGRPSRLLPFPAGMLQFGAKLLGKDNVAQRLLGSLQVDISQTRELLGWKPPYTLEEGLRRCFAPNGSPPMKA